MLTPDLLLVALLLLAVAALYSSVGHAGASGYLAVLTLLFGIEQAVAKPTATVLNIPVAVITLTQFARAGHFRWEFLWPFLLGSVPFAFYGGKVTLPDQTYKLVVGAVLLAAAVRLAVGTWPTVPGGVRRPPILVAVGVGAGIGLLSGLTGTGGGIFLTPLLVLFRWADPKPAAAVSAAFILANSVAGLAGQLKTGVEFRPEMPYWVAAAVLGGLVGSSFGAWRLGGTTLRRLLAVVLVVAAVKLIGGVLL